MSITVGMMLYNKTRHNPYNSIKIERMALSMGQARTYTDGLKTQALKLAKEAGTKHAAEELGVPKNTFGTWVHKAKKREEAQIVNRFWNVIQ